MSHELEMNEATGEASFASLRKAGWHQLGTVLDEPVTAMEALRIAHMDGWNVHKEPMFLANGTQVPKRHAVVRTHPYTGEADVLGDVGNHWAPVQNEEQVELLDELVHRGSVIETLGSLAGGTRTFVTMKVPATMMVGGVDQVDVYIAALNSFDGQSSFKFIVTPIRIVCANTEAAALRNAKASFKARHTLGGAGVAVQQAREALDLTFKFVEEFEQEAERMIQETYTQQQFSRLTASLFPTPKGASTRVQQTQAAHRQTVAGLFVDSPTLQNVKDTRWGAYQAVTEYLDHLVPTTGKAGEAARDYRAQASIKEDSPATKLKLRAFKLLQVA